MITCLEDQFSVMKISLPSLNLLTHFSFLGSPQGSVPVRNYPSLVSGILAALFCKFSFIAFAEVKLLLEQGLGYSFNIYLV